MFEPAETITSTAPDSINCRYSSISDECALTGGRWQLNEVHGGIWEPYVLFDNDNDYLNPFLETYRNIVERRHGGLMLVPLVVAHSSTRLKHV